MNQIKMEAMIVSPLEKGFAHQSPAEFKPLQKQSVLLGEHLDFQFFYRDIPAVNEARKVEVRLEGAPGDWEIFQVTHVPVDFPTYQQDISRGTPYYIDSPTGTYPDVLEPIDQGKYLRPRPDKMEALFITGSIDQPGNYTLSVVMLAKGEEIARESLSVTVVDCALPEQSLIFTQWFHCDCLASYYNVPVFSEAHWKILEAYLRTAAQSGINCILTPVFTPPLDTQVGGERPTVQLVGVTVTADGYAFDFTLLDRWLDLTADCGIRYYEISHLFSQWGAEYAPKVVGYKDGELQRLFGWDTPGTGEAYVTFLHAFMPQLVAHLKERGVLQNCLFHVSDEPSEEHLAGYRKAKETIEPYVQGCRMIDALRHIELFRQGIVTTPIPATNRMDPFLAEDIDMRWAYYCCGQWNHVSNRFIAYPSFRNRIIGVQLYKFNIKGFLHWGYNFWYSMGSTRQINPFLNQSGDRQVPAGDAFSVYPGQNGQPLEALRLRIFREALEDYRALEKLESLTDRESVLSLIDEVAGMEITLSDYPASADYLHALREAVNGRIAEQMV